MEVWPLGRDHKSETRLTTRVEFRKIRPSTDAQIIPAIPPTRQVSQPQRTNVNPLTTTFCCESSSRFSVRINKRSPTSAGDACAWRRVRSRATTGTPRPLRSRTSALGPALRGRPWFRCMIPPDIVNLATRGGHYRPADCFWGPQSVRRLLLFAAYDWFDRARRLNPTFQSINQVWKEASRALVQR